MASVEGAGRAGAVRLHAQGGDRFGNPVGWAVETCTAAVLDLVAGEAAMDRAALAAALDPLIRIRAVQDVTPGEAVGFALLLKSAIRAEAAAAGAGISRDDLDAIDTRVDEVAIAAFDLYVACRQEVYEIRASEVRERSKAVLRRYGLMEGDPEGGEGEGRA